MKIKALRSSGVHQESSMAWWCVILIPGAGMVVGGVKRVYTKVRGSKI